MNWAMNSKISVFVICTEAIIYLLLHNLHDCIFKLRDNRIFRVLLRIKKSFQSIDFYQAKHVLVFNLNHHWNLFVKFQILKSRWVYWEANLAATSYSGKDHRQGKKQTLLSVLQTFSQYFCTQEFRLIKDMH